MKWQNTFVCTRCPLPVPCVYTNTFACLQYCKNSQHINTWFHFRMFTKGANSCYFFLKMAIFNFNDWCLSFEQQIICNASLKWTTHLSSLIYKWCKICLIGCVSIFAKKKPNSSFSMKLVPRPPTGHKRVFQPMRGHCWVVTGEVEGGQIPV